jgi:hypothetical protein
MSNTPTSWSFSKNPPIGNYGTIVDKRLTTITPTNPTGYTKLSTTSTDPVIQNMEYAIDINGNVSYEFTNATGRKIQYNNIQEMVSPLSGANQINNWDAINTTALFKNSLQTNLTQRTQDIIINQTSPVSPFAQSPTPGSPDLNAVNLGNIDTTNFEIKSIDAAVKKHGDYKYPLDMPNDMDKIKFTMIEYRGSRLKSNQLGFEKRFDEKDETTGKTKDIKNRLGTVTMGIQPRISDRNSVGWSDTDANTLGLLAGGTSLQLMQQGGAGITEILNKIGNTFEAEKGNIGTALKLKLAGEAASISGLTSRIGGAIFNPNLELLFDNPQLRPFDFTFQLTPRDPDEARAVKQIIRFFKQGMAVQRTAADLFLKAPNVFDINYVFGQKEDHPGLNKIKTCALQSFNVDYTPTGSYMTFSDGTMTAYSITLSFKELEPVYSDEYDVDKQANETVDSVRIGF